MSYERGGKKKRSEIIDYIETFVQDHGYPPTLREIGKAMDIRSPDTVKYHLDILREEKRVTWKEKANRTLRVLVSNPT